MGWLHWIHTPPEDEATLVAAFLLRRDEATFRRLYRLHAQPMYALAYRLSACSASEAEEAVQMAWMRAVERLGTFRGESALRTWLAGIVVNCVRELARQKTRHASVSSETFDVLSTRAPVVQSSLRINLERAIAGLPAGCREVLVLHDIEGYTHLEIGGLLGIESGTSKSQLFRARRALRSALEGALGGGDV